MAEQEVRHTLTFTITAAEEYMRAVLPGLKHIAQACHSIPSIDCELVMTPEQTGD